MKKTQIKTPELKPIEINDQAHPELYGILQMLKDRDENIPRIIRGLLLREFLPSYLVRNNAPESDVLNAIASWRRAIALLQTEYDTIERRINGASTPTPEPTPEPEPIPEPPKQKQAQAKAKAKDIEPGDLELEDTF